MGSDYINSAIRSQGLVLGVAASQLRLWANLKICFVPFALNDTCMHRKSWTRKEATFQILAVFFAGHARDGQLDLDCALDTKTVNPSTANREAQKSDGRAKAQFHRFSTKRPPPVACGSFWRTPAIKVSLPCNRDSCKSCSGSSRHVLVAPVVQ